MSVSTSVISNPFQLSQTPSAPLSPEVPDYFPVQFRVSAALETLRISPLYIGDQLGVLASEVDAFTVRISDDYSTLELPIDKVLQILDVHEPYDAEVADLSEYLQAFWIDLETLDWASKISDESDICHWADTTPDDAVAFCLTYLVDAT